MKVKRWIPLSSNVSKLKVGIIGTGNMGARHARNLQFKVVGAIVAGVYDLDLGRAEEVAELCGSPRIYSDPIQLIEDAQIEAVLIASPNETHADFTRACLVNEKPVFCEKPLAEDADEARNVIERELTYGRKIVSVGFMRRFDPQHASVKQSIVSGAIGHPIAFKGVHRNESVSSDFPAEFVISQSAVHDFDSARWLLEVEVEKVFAQGVRVDGALDSDVNDFVLVQLSFSGGRLGIIEVFLSARYGYEVSAEVIGEKGTAVSGQPDHLVIRSEQKRAFPVPGDWLGRFQEAYVLEMDSWVQSVRHGNLFQGADAWDGYMSLLISDACLASLASGRPEEIPTVVKPDLY